MHLLAAILPEAVGQPRSVGQPEDHRVQVGLPLLHHFLDPADRGHEERPELRRQMGTTGNRSTQKKIFF